MCIKTSFINSKNLYHVVKKRSLNQHELNSYLKAHPEFNRVIGSLPYDWLKDLEQKSDIKQLRASVASAFSQFASDISDIHTRRYLEAIRGSKLKLKKFHKRLEQELKDILKRQDISVSYAGSGAFKHCHKISVGDYEYALSTFVNNKGFLNEKYSNYFNTYFQGKGYEPQNVFTMYKNGPHGRWVKPFFSKVSRVDDTDGFVFSTFINKTRTPKNLIGTLERKHLRVFCNDDNINNTINGVHIDVGACVINDKCLKKQTLRNQLLPIVRLFDSVNRIVDDYAYRSLDNLVAGDICNNIDIFHKNYLKKYSLSHSQKKVMSNIIRHLKSLEKLKNNAEKKGLLESIKNVLNSDLQEEFPYEKDIRGDLLKYYSKSFSKLLGVSNKPNARDVILNYDQFAFWGTIQKDYTQNEIIDGLIQSWKQVSQKRSLLKQIYKDFAITNEQIQQIKKRR